MITSVQGWANVFDVGPTLYKCYANGLCLLGMFLIKHETLIHCWLKVGPILSPNWINVSCLLGRGQGSTSVHHLRGVRCSPPVTAHSPLSLLHQLSQAQLLSPLSGLAQIDSIHNVESEEGWTTWTLLTASQRFSDDSMLILLGLVVHWAGSRFLRSRSPGCEWTWFG